MLTEKDYIRSSLEANLFFCRIMKEHAIFLRLGLPPSAADAAKEALYFKDEFENLLAYSLDIGSGVVDAEFLNSGQIITDYTLNAEKKTSNLTGIPIDIDITRREQELCRGGPNENSPALSSAHTLNSRVLTLLEGFIQFKERYHKDAVSCTAFSWLYPDMIEHIRDEAQLFYSLLTVIEEKRSLNEKAMHAALCNWNEIMCEHAEYIRGLLDPSEENLMVESNKFAHEFGRLIQLQYSFAPSGLKPLVSKSLKETLKFRGFNESGTKGILDCGIKSVIIPLLADHLLREANHYSVLLNDLERIF